MNEYCKYCQKLLGPANKSGVCSNCQKGNIWRLKYEKLKEEFEKYKKLSDKVLLDFYNKLKKHEPDLIWDGEPPTKK